MCGIIKGAYATVKNLRICLCLACVYRVMDARGKFGEHEICVRVAQGPAESNSSFLSAFQTSQCIHNSIYIRTAKSMSKLFYNIADKNACFSINCKILATCDTEKQIPLLAGYKHATNV